METAVVKKPENIWNGVLTVDVPGDQWYLPTHSTYTHLTAISSRKPRNLVPEKILDFSRADRQQ